MDLPPNCGVLELETPTPLLVKAKQRACHVDDGTPMTAGTFYAPRRFFEALPAGVAGTRRS
jgi:hypothetical protein